MPKSAGISIRSVSATGQARRLSDEGSLIDVRQRSERWSKVGGGRFACVAVTASSSNRKARIVTVAGKLGDDLARGTWNGGKRRAGLKE